MNYLNKLISEYTDADWIAMGATQQEIDNCASDDMKCTLYEDLFWREDSNGNLIHPMAGKFETDVAEHITKNPNDWHDPEVDFYPKTYDSNTPFNPDAKPKTKKELVFREEPITYEDGAQLLAMGYNEKEHPDAFEPRQILIGYKLRKPKLKYPKPDATPEEVAVFTNKFAAQVDATKPVTTLVTTRGDKITTKRIRWMWSNRIPFGKLSVISGNPDNGKSLISLYIAAQLTSGRPLYGMTSALPPCEVLVLAGEDDADDTVIPRLQSMGANLSKIHVVQSVCTHNATGTLEERSVALDTDIKTVEEMLQQNPAIRLVIIDPVSNYLGRQNMNREQEVRGVLMPLKDLAARQDAAILLIAHLNKNSESAATNRVSGAMAFVGLCRSAWLCVENPEEPTEHLFLRIKNNIAARTNGLVYKIQAKPIEIEGTQEYQPYVEWLRESTHGADNVLVGGKRVGPPPEKLQNASSWLKELLSHGGETSQDIKRLGKEAGFTWRTLERAKDDLEVEARKAGKGWEWVLPGTPILEPASLDNKGE